MNKQKKGQISPIFFFVENGRQKKKNGRIMGALPIFFLLRKWALKKKNMGSAHILVLGFLGPHNPYTPSSEGLKPQRLQKVT